MYDELKNLLKHGSVYTLGIVLSRIVSFIMIPLYTNLLKPEEYGTLELLSLSVDIISTIMGFGMTAAVVRYFFKSDDEHYRNRVISTAFLGTAGIMAAASALSIAFSSPISVLLFHSPENAILLRIIFTTMFISSVIEVPLAYLRILQKSLKFVTVGIVRLTLQLGLNIFFLVYMRMGVIGVLYSGLITSIIIGAYLLISTFAATGLRFSRSLYVSMLAYGFPLIASDISAFILTFSDRFFINYYGDLADVGLYSLAYKFGMLLSMVFVAPFYQIWSARMFHIYNQENSKETISKILTLFLFGALTINLGISLLTKDVLRLISNPAYWDAYRLVPVISMAYVLNGIIYVVGIGILAQGKTKYTALAMTLAMIANLGLNFLLIPKWGKTGAAYATLVSYTIRVLLIYYFSQKFFKVHYEWGKIGRIAIISIALIALGRYVTIENVLVSLTLNFLMIIVFLFVIYSIGFFNEREKEFIRQSIRNPLKIMERLKGGLG